MKFELTLLTPVHIGAGEEKNLSHVSDYYLDEATDEVCYIDHARLEAFMRDYLDPKQIMDDLVRRIRSEQSQAQDKYGIKAFLEDYSANPAEFVRERVPVLSPETLKSQMIQPTVRNAGKPYIPGSSLKGAIRTALLYHELIGTQKNELQNELAKIKQLQWRDAQKGLSRFLDELYGRYAQDTFRFLRISDTSTLSHGSLNVVHARRLRLKSTNDSARRQDIPLNYEAIMPGAAVPFEMRCLATRDETPKNPHIKSYLEEGGELQILELINAYSRRFVESEIERLQNSNSLAPIRRYYAQELLPTIEHLGEGEAILSLGRGKTYFNSSIGLVFAPDELQQVRKLYELGENRRNHQLVEPFPITRTMVIKNNQPYAILGWVKIRRIE